MSTYYVDPAATGVNNGSSWTDAWTSLQTAADTAVAGDIVYCRGTETPSAIIDIDTNSGNYPDLIQFIGCNSSGDDDGTRYILDGTNLGSGSVITYASEVGLHFWKNFESKNSPGDGIVGNGTTDSVPVIFWNCGFNNNGGRGIGTYFNAYSVWILCEFRNNTSYGYYRPYQGRMLFCSFIGNGSTGLDYYHDPIIVGCISHDNGGHGLLLEDAGYPDFIMNCTSDGNSSDGINSKRSSQLSLLFGNRLTNNTNYGLNCSNNGLKFENWNFFLNNVSGTKTGLGLFEIGDSLISGTEGYEDKANDNFNLTSDATLRRTAITIPTS